MFLVGEDEGNRGLGWLGLWACCGILGNYGRLGLPGGGRGVEGLDSN